MKIATAAQKESATAAVEAAATSTATTRHIWWIATSNLGKIITPGVWQRS